jgi:predicted ArsR family transcriptional regulator
VVARYARLVIAAERLDKDTMSEARQLEDRLGLTPKAMRLLLWEIAADEVAVQRQDSAGARGRIKAV